MRAYSRCCVRELRPSLRLALGPLETVLALNVEKEVRKDALAITAGGKKEIAALLRDARDIDREFLGQLGSLPLRLEIRYEELEPIRRQRLERLSAAAARLLQAPWRGIRPAVRASYARTQFEALLRGHLELYAGEVHALNRSLRIPALLAPLRERVAGRLRAIMERQSQALARDVTRLLYG